ncbi:type II secretion system minor pseudopilin GspJ [Sulfurirhabdus autotrophica]|uniref:Type II secretion system protein J n=1 Tax=Sulfurirhabdus autotrophica TaxID=1706046 RepID=A0A4R3Y097_9PROT|nr:type II secretion system minor pseudopilin GspJ [Sulfurirhabdus autotrophica]TCV83413.1 general secretion pathway protein J [Sulfurirhabdus autotrophica]
MVFWSLAAQSKEKVTHQSNKCANVYTISGFTLLELLVAIAIFSVMSVVAYRGLNATLETRAHLLDDNRKWRELSLFFAQMKDSLTNVVNRPVRNNNNDLVLPAFAGKPEVIGEDDAQLVFTRIGLPGQLGSLGGLQRYGYRLREHNIEQLVWPVLDQAPRTQPAVFQVLPHVTSFVMRYLDKQGKWQSKWPVLGQNDVAPQAVEIRVGLQSGEQIVRLFAL